MARDKPQGNQYLAGDPSGWRMSNSDVLTGLRVHRSNRVEVLAALLSAWIRERHLDGAVDPMQPDIVVVGNRGTERWLSHRLAEELTVCAHVSFPFPASVIEQLIAWGCGGGSRSVKWSQDAVQFAILLELDKLDAAPEWAPLVDWLGAEPRGGDQVVDRRRLGLAQQLARVFDRLCTFRPEWMVAWATAAPATLPPGVVPWLPLLWQRLVERQGPGNPAERLVTALRTLRTTPVGGMARRPPMPQLHLFGLSSLPPPYLEVLAAAGLHLAVDLYLLSPSDQYWADVRRGSVELPSPLVMARDRLVSVLEETLPPDEAPGPGRTRANPALATFGRLARDFQAVLERLPGGYRERSDEVAEWFMDPVPESSLAKGPAAPALAWLQSDILHMRHPADHKRSLGDFERRRLQPDDASLQLHACYGLTRQVEALHDALLDLFDTHPNLHPRDVVVMCPQIDQVAPLVSAIFGRARGWGAPPEIPFRITDRTLRELNPVAEVVLRLLNMGLGRLEAPAVLDLLSLEPVRVRFGLEPEQLPAVSDLVRVCGARWARDADHRVAHGQPSDRLCTWRFGLERLALGLVMADEASRDPFLEVLPEDTAIAVDRAVLGALLDFMATLSEELDLLAGARSPAEWSAVLQSTLDRLVAPTTPAGFRIRQVRELLDTLVRSTESEDDTSGSLWLDGPALAAWLEGHLSEQSGPVGQQTGAVTFCSMLPQRGVPSRVVCLLGMDEGAFPRMGSSLGFDPTTSHPRVGDRDPRDEDRYLLLEALLAARDHLLVFFTGRDVRTNEDLPPAVPVGELIDVMEASFLPPHGWDSVRRWLLVEHPLQAFSPRALSVGGLASSPDQQGGQAHRLAASVWSFDRRLERSARSLLKGKQLERPFWPAGHRLPSEVVDEAGAGNTVVPLDDFVGFFRQPVAWLVERELGLWLRERDATVPDREAVELDELERYLLRYDLIEAALRADRSAAERIWSRRSARGDLPPGTLGRLAFDDAWEPVQMAASLLDGVLDGAQPRRVEVDLGPHGQLVGTVPGVGAEGLAELVLGGWEGRKVLASWLRAVALTASGSPVSAVVAWTGDARRKPGSMQLRPFQGDTEAARDHLRWLAGVRAEGLCAPVMLFERSSFAFVSQKVSRNGPLVATVLRQQPDDPKALAAGAKAARQAWRGSDRMRGDVQDAAVAQMYGTAPPFGHDTASLSPDFVALAMRFWTPLLDAAAEAS